MAKKVLLHTQLYTFSTYHAQAEVGILVMQNPSIYNWVLNNTVMLFCNRRFLTGHTTPEIFVQKSALPDLPCSDSTWMSCRFLDGHVHYVIRNALDQGYYVGFSHIDDYWIKGKSFYKEKHRIHDGMICGYDQEKKTYYIFAYDENWIFRVFETPQSCFEKSIESARKMGLHSSLRAFKASGEKFPLEPKLIVKNLKTYLDSNIEKYPIYDEGDVLGTAVHNYMVMYIDMLYKGKYVSEHADRRVIRMIWEHKKCMYDRIHAVEAYYHFGYDLSDEYKEVVNMADRARIVYAMFIKNKRKEILKDVKELIEKIQEKETDILNRFIKKTEEKF